MTDPESAAFYDYTRRLLIDVQRVSDPAKMRRIEIRINSKRFEALSESRQEDLLLLLAGAGMRNGVFS